MKQLLCLCIRAIVLVYQQVELVMLRRIIMFTTPSDHMYKINVTVL